MAIQKRSGIFGDCIHQPAKRPRLAHENERVLKVGANEYIFEKDIGSGEFGRVYKATAENGDTVAVKELLDPKTLEDVEQFDNEAKILGHLGELVDSNVNPTVIPPTDHPQYVVSRFYEGSTLKSLLVDHLIEHDGALTTEEFEAFFVQVRSKFEELHEKRVKHDDGHLENIIAIKDESSEGFSIRELHFIDYGKAKIMEHVDEIEARDDMRMFMNDVREFMWAESAWERSWKPMSEAIEKVFKDLGYPPDP